MILTTIDWVPGFEVDEIKGVAVGCVPYWGSKFAEGISDLKGQTTADLPAAMEARRIQALERLVVQGEAVGANAVIGVRMDHREVTTMWKELCAYGTAVVLVPLAD